MRGWDQRAITKAAGLPPGELDRFMNSRRVYLETSAFNYFCAQLTGAELERMGKEGRDEGIIFVASPMLFWEIMLSSDAEHADRLLFCAQALLDPVLLATPSDLAARYLRFAYPENLVNYSYFADAAWLEGWRAMTEDYARTFTFQGHLEKARTFRVVSRNLRSVIENKSHADETVALATTFVTLVYTALGDDLAELPLDQATAKLVILYTYLLLLLPSDLENSDADALWRSKGFVGELEHAQISRVFIEYPGIFERGPLLEMANLAALQFRSGATNRGVLHDGMHMAYAPFVDLIYSRDSAFVELGKQSAFYRAKIKCLRACLRTL